MSLKNYDFLPIYSKDKNDLYNDFYKICIENSIKYDRITGYFGSSIFVVITEALKKFITNKGKIRIICSPVMSEEDHAAILKGYQEKINEKITSEILKEIENLKENYEKPLELLSNLIKYDYLEIKLAIFKGNNHSSFSQLVHDKIGLFVDDENNMVAFGGSMNETYSGISNYGNLESFSVFTNWEGSKDKFRVENYHNRFEEIWNKESKSVLTFDFPEEATSLIKKYSTNVNIKDLLSDLFKKNQFQKKINDKWYAEIGENRRKARPHQIMVLDNWEKNGKRGVFEMATGSGKTFIAMCAIRKALANGEIPLIIVPSSILLNQWKEEVEKVFLKDEEIKLLLCGSGNNKWRNNNILTKFTKPSLNMKRIIISTIQTAHTDDFIDNIIMSDKLFLIVDEVHRSGSSTFSNIFRIESGARIGLSATPDRFRDSVGTQKIIDYFENKIEPKYDLFQAISEGNLTPYNYYFSTIYLNEEEQIDWNNLTIEINKKIAWQMSKSENNTLNVDKSLEMLLIKRARIVKKANNKIQLALDVLKKYYKKGQSWLIYCEDEEQLDTIFYLLEKENFRRFYYISDMNSDKEETLRTFEKVGGILVSIKCLDEGVDIPSISHALILASSTNPREYIQRRGRVLRKSKNKDISYIFDCITLPNNEIYETDQTKGLSIIKSEIARSLHFAEHAENKIESIYNLNKILINYDIDLDIDAEGGFENELE